VRKGDDLTTFIVPKVMKNSKALTFRIPNGLFRPVARNLYLFYTHTYVQCQSLDGSIYLDRKQLVLKGPQERPFSTPKKRQEGRLSKYVLIITNILSWIMFETRHFFYRIISEYIVTD
jgi:hypothetical protein